jgi:hypothetical protein
VDGKLAVKEITSLFVDRHGEDYERKVTPKWVGLRLRKTLNLKPWKSHGNFVIHAESRRLGHLYEKYGIAVDLEPQSKDLFSGTSGTWGDAERSRTESPA